MKTLIFLCLSLSLSTISFARDETNDGMGEVKLPLITNVEGESNKVKIINSSHTEKKANTDEYLEAGDTVSVSKGNSLSLSYENGAELFIAENSVVKTQVDEGQNSNEEVSTIEVLKGKVRGIFKEEKTQKSKKFKLFIRTKNSVMGVRGTEFVVENKDGESSLHTIEGSVEFAKSKDDLFKGNSSQVKESEFIKRKKQEKIRKPQKFKKEEFLKRFKNRHPRLVKLRQNFLSSRNSGQRVKRFNAARKKFRKQIMRSRAGRKYRRERRNNNFNNRKNFRRRDGSNKPDKEKIKKVRKEEIKEKIKETRKKRMDRMMKRRKKKRERLKRLKPPPPPGE
jgi:hypothetical protein